MCHLDLDLSELEIHFQRSVSTVRFTYCYSNALDVLAVNLRHFVRHGRLRMTQYLVTAEDKSQV